MKHITHFLALAVALPLLSCTESSLLQPDEGASLEIADPLAASPFRKPSPSRSPFRHASISLYAIVTKISVMTEIYGQIFFTSV